MKKLNKFLRNKNTVTILGIILILFLLFFAFNATIKSTVNPIKVPVAKEKILPETEITQDKVMYANVSKMVLTDNVYYAKKVRMRIESSNDSFSGNVVIIPVLNGEELESYVCGTGNWSEISFSSLGGGVATGSLFFMRDTNNELDTLKDDAGIITAIVTVLEVVYER